MTDGGDEPKPPRVALPVDFDMMEPLANVLLLGGRIAAATPYLSRMAGSCRPLWSCRGVVHASLHLGDVLATQGDKPGACAAYAAVLARWGAA